MGDAFQKQRNVVKKIKKSSLKVNFENKCENIKNNDPRQFWQIIISFISNKDVKWGENIMLIENESAILVNNPEKLYEKFDK